MGTINPNCGGAIRSEEGFLKLLCGVDKEYRNDFDADRERCCKGNYKAIISLEQAGTFADKLVGQ